MSENRRVRMASDLTGSEVLKFGENLDTSPDLTRSVTGIELRLTVWSGVLCRVGNKAQFALDLIERYNQLTTETIED